MPQPNIQYLTINDFRAGIVAGNRSGATIVSPPGAAQAGTVGCIANVQGQLVPLPSPTLYATITPTGAFTGAPTCLGIASSGPVWNTSTNTMGEDLHVWIDGIQTGAPTHDVLEWWVQKPGAAFARIFTLTGVASPSVNTIRGLTHTLTRIASASFGSPGHPTLVMEWTSNGSATVFPNQDGSIFYTGMFPNPAAPNLDTPFLQTSTVNNAAFSLGGPVLAHDGRILKLLENDDQHGANTLFFTNERVRYTDPPNSVDLLSTTTDSILDPQYPGGYGAWGSLSFGELLLIKRYGGAILVEGDIYAPSITRLGGVYSTGNNISETASTIAGLVYVTDDGVYLWNGGSSSQRLNSDGIFPYTTFYNPNIFNNGVTSSCVSYHDLVIFSGNYVWDPLNQSFWQLPTIQSCSFFAASTFNQNLLFGTRQLANPQDASGKIEIYQWDATVPSVSYSWISQPMVVSDYQSVDIREVVISFGEINAGGTVQVTVKDITGTTLAAESIGQPTSFQSEFRVRQPLSAHADIITLTVSVVNPVIAPIINSIEIGYVPAQPLPRSQ